MKGLSPSGDQVLAHMLEDHRFIIPFPLVFLHTTVFTKGALLGLVSGTNTMLSWSPWRLIRNEPSLNERTICNCCWHSKSVLLYATVQNHIEKQILQNNGLDMWTSKEGLWTTIHVSVNQGMMLSKFLNPSLISSIYKLFFLLTLYYVNNGYGNEWWMTCVIFIGIQIRASN